MKTDVRFLYESAGGTYRVYHGSRRQRPLTALRVPMSGTTPISTWGVFFTDSLKLARSFAGARGIVYAADITLKNPRVMPPTRSGWTATQQWETDANDEEREEFIRDVRADGHDGLVFQTSEGFTEYVVFEPRQIVLHGPVDANAT